MKKTSQAPVAIHSLPQLHRLVGLAGPSHPLISLVDNTQLKLDQTNRPDSLLLDFYKISYKKTLKGRMGYGQGYYDFDEGGMIFTAPHQLIQLDDDIEYQGFSLLLHPDFFRNYPLAKTIRQYGFFAYDTHEALHLSDKEKDTILNVLASIGAELDQAIDEVSQDLIVSYVEVLLNYSNRFYKRQFITRKTVNHDLLMNMEQLLESYFAQGQSLKAGLPSVEYLADQLHVSPRYLSDMLRSLTGQSAQQHIHQKLIEKAKEYLAASNLSVAEIAYELGFERPQSFNKLFRKKTSLSPLEFKQSFN